MGKAVTVTTEKKQRKAAAPKAVAPVPPKPEATERDKLEAADAKARILSRRKRVQVKSTGEGRDVKLDASHSDYDGWAAQLKDAFGTTSHDFMARSMALLATAMQRSGQGRAEGINAGLAVVAGVRPENETEAMLAVQMAATHEAAMSMLDIARGNGAVPAIQAAGGLAVKLLRTYTTQVETLAKLRRGGEQTVRVEHVHVHSGGQAIVGAINHPGGGGVSLGNGSQPHAPIDPKAIAFAPGSPVWSEDTQRGAVPVPGGEW
ncbi:hypothetical protein HPT29_028580 (plasmid) [Microvirga terrae]|uniref:Uncharacterized protein n=1 Tax=Microvirga terrae TaxID=2740529 RepID=A0ABY5S0U3_9HYPH|nr:hypothetical protein [Microvirga terrae]UVF22888.1 hypothetical protein HPT29_028580 [Microvirga terrae]